MPVDQKRISELLGSTTEPAEADLASQAVRKGEPSVSLFDLESARQESDRLKKTIFEALQLLRPQTRVMNPSLAAVREAVVILQRAH